MSALPSLDVLYELLFLLSIKDLLRFKCLSKTFYSIINSQDFINFHLNKSIKNKTNRVLIIDEVKPKGSIYAVDLDSHPHKITQLDRPYEPHLDTIEYFAENGKWKREPRKFDSDVIGSCNGLLAMDNGNTITLWNPSTKMHHDLPHFGKKTYWVDGFGFDYVKDDYKVVRIIQPCENQNNCKFLKVMVYSLKDNSITRIENLHGYKIGLMKSGGVGVQIGASLHWSICPSFIPYGDERILAFNLRDEKFHEVPLPDGMEDTSLQVGELGECLVICNRNVEIWVMKEYGVKESWTKLCTMSPKKYGMSFYEKRYFKTLCYTRSGDEVIFDFQDRKYFLLYDIANQTLRKVRIFGSSKTKKPEYISANVCLRSLVPVNINAAKKPVV